MVRDLIDTKIDEIKNPRSRSFNTNDNEDVDYYVRLCGIPVLLLHYQSGQINV